MKIDWKRKLTSRKSWVAVVGLVSGLVLAFNGSAETAETVSGCIMSAASVIAYAIGEHCRFCPPMRDHKGGMKYGNTS